STVNFRVAGQTLVDFYGNFPNPFGAQGTIFAFSFSAQISEVTFRIYDLAGRLVLKFSNYDLSALYPDDSPSLHQSTSPYRLLDRNGLPLVAPSYHELEWSGRNARGEFLANGVYFGIITVRDEAGDEVAKRIFKMVKAE
ncbi:MAG TPA: T9SS type A sorting domain-containing protein, partial [Candidatus Latescibacteria bacterium]|nr:T9SS type A sorting domain-containing protein [Candidatus Latescibacterota bacterium]